MRMNVLHRASPILLVALLGGCQGNPPLVVFGGLPANIRVQELIEGTSAEVDVSPYFRDPDGDRLTYATTTSDADVAAARVSGSRITIIAAAPGNTSITVTASDPDGLTAPPQRIRVIVEAANRAPAAVGGIRLQELVEGTGVEINVSSYFRDPDGDRLAYSASTSRAAVVAVVRVSGSTIRIGGAGAGDAVVTVTARDPDGLTASPQEIRVIVEAANRAPVPVGRIGALELIEGDTVEIDVSRYFRDPDGDLLTYQGRAADVPVAATTVSGRTVRIVAKGEGSTMVVVAARDPEGLTATQGISVAVEGVTVRVELCQIDRTFNAVSGRPTSSIACELTVAYLETTEASPSVQSVTRVTEFTASQGQIGGAVVSSDDELYYWHLEDRAAGRANLWRMPTPGVSRTPVTTGSSLDIDPSVAPAGANMVFASNRNGRPSSLWLVPTDGGVGLTMATQTIDADYAPSLSPDGAWIAFERWLPGVRRPDIWKIDLATGFETQLREGHRPRVSPDGSMILYNRRNRDTDRFEIWRMNADGGVETLLSTGADHDEIQPSWSPDGNAIVFASNEGLDRMRQPNYDIWSMSTDLGIRTQLTTNGSYDDEPVWHPDGRIFFRSNRGGSWNIWYLTVERVNPSP